MTLACRYISSIVGCSSDGLTNVAVIIHYEYGVASNGNTLVHAVRYTKADGTIYVPPAGYTINPGACVFNCGCPPTNLIVTGGSAGAMIAGPTRAATAAFLGASPTASTSSAAGQLQSVTVTAKGVTDGFKNGSTPNQIVVACPDGSDFIMMDGQTFTWSLAGREQEMELKRDYTITATGNAYANIGYTFI
jgi:hypothetical protein